MTRPTGVCQGKRRYASAAFGNESKLNSVCLLPNCVDDAVVLIDAVAWLSNRAGAHLISPEIIDHRSRGMITATSRVESGGPNEDRIFVDRRGAQIIAVVCDGAGNGGRGGVAADLAIAELKRVWQAGFVDWVRVLLSVDQMLLAQAEGGETTCVGIVISDDGWCRGASVGDSGAWMLSRRRPVQDLTAGQDRLRLGSGRAHPIMFKTQLMGSMLLASDGLLKYIGVADIRSCAARGVDALIDSVRLKGGALQDDVAVILLE